MFKRTRCSPYSILALFLILATSALPVAAATDAHLSETYGKLPLQFEANQGQAHKDVRFLARGAGYNLYLTAHDAVLVLSQPNPEGNRYAPGVPMLHNA